MATRTKSRRKRLPGGPPRGAGDVEAGVPRAIGGEEAPDGTVTTPDPDDVDALGKAVGVPRAPDEPFRASSEIVDARADARREQEE
jgi:uncharacterized protein DUF6335